MYSWDSQIEIPNKSPERFVGKQSQVDLKWRATKMKWILNGV